VAGLPVRRPELSDAAGQLQPPRPPAHVQSILDRLWQSGHAAYVVGGGVRDWLLGRAATDWDIATDARPERMLELFPNGHYENKFGTVSIGGVEATTFRRDHQYGDHRRPDSVTFTDDIVEDLARRDFTVNAIAWGRTRDAGRPAEQPHWTDPTNGADDLRDRLIRAVGDPERRFDEDALRLVRAARLAAELGFEIEPQTRAAMARSAHLVQWVSRERVGIEFRRMVRAEPPSTAFRILAETNLLEPLFPELAAQVGVPQSKIPGADLWHHSLTTVEAAATLGGSSERLRVTALLHDIGKPTTFAGGHFVGHDSEGARLAEELLSRLAFGRREIEPVVALIGQHMFVYQPSWTAAAVRRFIRRVGADRVADLLRLRQADNVGSGLPADAGHLDELRRRVAAELQSGAPLNLRDLAVDGGDLTSELDLAPGPVIGRLLDHLLEWVIEDAGRNTRELLLAEARAEVRR
jgi:tRNA nucleotidyltransferase (CCA-adding enzyme)